MASVRALSRLVSARPVIRQAVLPHSKFLHASTSRQDIPQWPNPPVPQPNATPYSGATGQNPPSHEQSIRDNVYAQLAASPIVQAGVTTVIGLIAVFAGGVGYLVWYKAHVLNKMEGAFAAGYDPALEVGKLHHRKHLHRHAGKFSSEDGDADEEDELPRPSIIRKEQDIVDKVVRGETVGNYWMLMGSKGTGKKHAIVESMRAISADGAAFAEAHGDLEVFRLRLGKALHYEFNEDWQGSLFSRRDPREGGPRLDIERAMNKLEKVALRYTERRGRPLVLAFSDIHLFPNDEEGIALIQQLQQRAEAWAEAGICSMIFTTDDYWPYEAMKKNASRLKVLALPDLPADEASNALRYLRMCYGPEDPLVRARDRVQVPEVLRVLGGRTSYLLRAAKAPDMLHEAKEMLEIEKQWLLSRIALIPELDDDVMDSAKWASCSWLLLQEFVKQQQKREAEGLDGQDPLELPVITHGKAQVIMTRPDFITPLDQANIISIDNKFRIRPESTLILRAAEEFTAEEEFESDLTVTRDRVDEIEGLHRQSEITVKEGMRITVKTGSLWSWLIPGSTKTTIAVEGRGKSFVPEEKEEE